MGTKLTIKPQFEGLFTPLTLTQQEEDYQMMETDEFERDTN
jgi:hypothetical protein